MQRCLTSVRIERSFDYAPAVPEFRDAPSVGICPADRMSASVPLRLELVVGAYDLLDRLIWGPDADYTPL